MPAIRGYRLRWSVEDNTGEVALDVDPDPNLDTRFTVTSAAEFAALTALLGSHDDLQYAPGNQGIQASRRIT